MKYLLLAALLFTSTHPARADERIPIFPGPIPANIMINVVKYVDILEASGSSLRCLKANNKFGYVISRVGEDFFIDVISNGELEGEKTRMQPVRKDYGSPFIIYLSVHRRDGDYGNYFELLLHKRVNPADGKLQGDVMFTEATYYKVGEEEKVTFKPVWRERLFCEVGE